MPGAAPRSRWWAASCRARFRVVAVALGLGAVPASAQRPFTGYFQTVGLAGTRGDLLAHFNRFRLAGEVEVGPFRASAAYEHALTLRRSEALPGFGLAGVPSGGEWLDLQWTLAEGERLNWQHRFDRLQLAWVPTDDLEITVGRQAVSWGTTLFLTPGDPFRPFNPVDPFREFRAGVDALRVRFFPSALSELDLVVNRTGPGGSKDTTALVRGLTTVRSWEVSGWGGAVQGQPAGALGTAGSLGSWAVRAEAVLRRLEEESFFRGAIGLDRRLQVADRDLTLAFEYQRDGLGASGPDDAWRVLTSDTFRRGEHQVLGRDEAVIQTGYQIHPLWSLSGLVLVNLNDGSAIVGPGVAWSAGENATVAAGLFVGLGDDERTRERPIPSEFGLTGTIAYISLSWFLF